ncbi:MAG: alpha/beta hydrolase [Bacteroidota bacterium]
MPAIKRNWTKRLLKWCCYLLVLFFLLPLLSNALPSGLNPKKTRNFFAEHKVSFSDTQLSVQGRKMRFVCTGNDTMPIVFFIHGSPGSWDAFKDYLADSMLRTKAYLIAVDRPGYGESGNEGVATLADQVKFISGVLQLRKNTKQITVVSHSYGGPVAVKFALTYPEITKQIMLISPTISPSIEEDIKWKRKLQKMSKWWGWRWAISRDLKNSTKEMQPLPDELRLMEPAYINFKTPIIELHGTEDPLAPYGNQEYVKYMFTNTTVDTVTYPNESHFFVWSKTAEIIQMIADRL